LGDGGATQRQVNGYAEGVHSSPRESLKKARGKKTVLPHRRTQNFNKPRIWIEDAKKAHETESNGGKGDSRVRENERGNHPETIGKKGGNL